MEEGQRRGRQGHDGHDYHQSEAETLVLNHIYDGHVTNVKNFGTFVKLHGVGGNLTGLIHVSRLADGLKHPSDLVARGQQVKVKVISMDGTRIGLSMKDVDQNTGRDLAPRVNFASSANMEPLGRGGNEHIDAQIQTTSPATKHQRRMTLPERWEIRQLIAAGVAKASDFPELEDHNAPKVDGAPELEEDLDIEVRDDEPPFLIGQTRQSLELSPIRVVKAPDGSMNRAAVAGTVLAKERAELRQQRTAEAATEPAGSRGSKVGLSRRRDDSKTDSKQPEFAGEAGSVNPVTAKPDSISSHSLAD
jgi:ATP-dependent RNA helicase DHX8/PRP22